MPMDQPNAQGAGLMENNKRPDLTPEDEVAVAELMTAVDASPLGDEYLQGKNDETIQLD